MEGSDCYENVGRTLGRERAGKSSDQLGVQNEGWIDWSAE